VVEISVVVPVYGCRDCLRALHERLRASVEEITASFELIFVDDRSVDGSWEVLRELAREDSAVRVVRLSRNFGQHPAISAGLAEATGRWVVVTDCDLEDPPEEIPRLYAKAAEGYDFVLARRLRRRQSFLRRIGATGYRRLSNLIAGADVDPNFTNLSIVSSHVVREALRMRDIDREYLLVLLWLGFNHAVIDVEQDERHAGHSAYTFSELVRVAADGIFFQTTRVLRWIVYTGFFVAALGILLAAFLVYNAAERNPPEGWTSLAVLVLILGGVIIITAGVIGLYVGKTFNQVKGRPLYVVDTRVVNGVEEPEASATPLETAIHGDPSPG
jgi:dolichol-phosphate mannosyltransferase